MGGVRNFHRDISGRFSTAQISCEAAKGTILNFAALRFGVQQAHELLRFD
jgi:hypothetical protein